MLRTLGIQYTVSAPQVWWEIALLCQESLPEVGPTVFPVARHIRALIFEQTNLHMPIPALAFSKSEVTDYCNKCHRTGHKEGLCAYPVDKLEVLPNWTGFNMDPLWVKMGLSQVDRERLANGRWASYIPYQNVEIYQCTPPDTRLSKYRFDDFMRSKAIDIGAVEDTLVQLYKLGLCNFDQMAVVA